MSLEQKISVAVIGATGKAGLNALSELSAHPRVKCIYAVGRNNLVLKELERRHTPKVVTLEFDKLEKLADWQPDILFMVLRAAEGDTFGKGIYQRSAQLAANFDLLVSAYSRLKKCNGLFVNYTNPMDIYCYVGCVYAEKNPYQMLGLSADTIRLNKEFIWTILRNHPDVQNVLSAEQILSSIGSFVIGLHEVGYMIPVFEEASFLGFKAELLSSVEDKIDKVNRRYFSEDLDQVRKKITEVINEAGGRIKELLGPAELATDIREPLKLLVDAYLNPDLVIPASTFLYCHESSERGLFIGNRVRIQNGRVVPDVITGLSNETKRAVLQCFNYAGQLINRLHAQGMPYIEDSGLVSGNKFTVFQEKTGRAATLEDICLVSGFEQSSRVFAASGNQVLGWFPDQPNEPVLEINYTNRSNPVKSKITCVCHKKLNGADKLFIGVRGKIIQLDYPSLKVDAVYETGADKYVRDIDFTSDGFVAVDETNLYGWNYNTPARKKAYTGASGNLKTVKAIKHQGIEKILVPGDTVYVFDVNKTENPVMFQGVCSGEKIRSVAVDNPDNPTCIFGAGERIYRWDIRNPFNPEISEEDLYFQRPYIGYCGRTQKLFVGDQSKDLLVVMDANTLETISSYDKGTAYRGDGTGYLRFARLGTKLPRNWLLVSDLNLVAGTSVPFLHIFDPADNKKKPCRTLIGAEHNILYFDVGDVTDTSLEQRVMNLTL